MGNLTKNLILWVVIAMVLMAVFKNFAPSENVARKELEYSTFLAEVTQGRVEKVVIDGRTISGNFTNGESFLTYSPDDPKLVDELVEAGVVIIAKKEELSLIHI